MKLHNKKPTSISVSSLRDPLYHMIMDELNPLVVDEKTGKVSVGKSELAEKERWNLLKRINKRMINARGNPIGEVKAI